MEKGLISGEYVKEPGPDEVGSSAEEQVAAGSNGGTDTRVSTPTREGEAVVHDQRLDEDFVVRMFEYNIEQDQEAISCMFDLVQTEEHHHIDLVQTQEHHHNNNTTGYSRKNNIIPNIQKVEEQEERGKNLIQENVRPQIFHGSNLNYNAIYKLLRNYYASNESFLTYGLFLNESVKQKIITFFGENNRKKFLLANHIAIPEYFHDKLGQKIKFNIIAKMECGSVDLLLVYIDEQEFLQKNNIYFLLFATQEKNIVFQEMQNKVEDQIGMFKPIQQQMMGFGVIGRMERNGEIYYGE